MLKRIRIRNYKSFEDVEIHLGNLTILFGPNGAGKSNLLDALQLLSRLASFPTLIQAFEPPYRGTALQSVRFGPGGMKELRRQDKVSFSFEVDVQLSRPVIESVNAEIKQWLDNDPLSEGSGAGKSTTDRSSLFLKNDEELRYSVEIEVVPARGFARIINESLHAISRKRGKARKSAALLERDEKGLSLVIEGQNKPMRFSLPSDYALISGQGLYSMQHPRLYALRRELTWWHFFYFEPRHIMRLSSPVREVPIIDMAGQQLGGFLNTLKDADPERFKAVEKTFHLIVPSVTAIDVGVNDAGEVELKLVENGTPIPAKLISDGTLRILGLVALGGYRLPPTLIAFEEPENGVHPRRIRLVAEMLRNRAVGGNTQMIVTTHSPILPNIIPKENLFICRKQDNSTRIEPFSEWELASSTSDPEVVSDEEEQLSVSERILRGDFDAA